MAAIPVVRLRRHHTDGQLLRAAAAGDADAFSAEVPTGGELAPFWPVQWRDAAGRVVEHTRRRPWLAP